MNTIAPQRTTAFSTRVADLHPSPIREILSVINRPGMISFAGGLPAIDSFPRFNLDAMPQQTLQYGASEGEMELRQLIAEELHERGLPCSAEQVLILSGSQQGIDLVAKLFIDPGTAVAVESPTYLAALQVFRFFGASFATYRMDGLENRRLQDEHPAFIYSIPTFQNPSGRCLTAEERECLAAVCDAGGIPLFEDDPYRDLMYDACERQPVCARLRHSPWIYQGSFSKNLAPGLRLGYLAASAELLAYLTRLKQAADLHSSRLSQWLVTQQFQNPLRKLHQIEMVELYRQRRNVFEAALRLYFSDIATWQTPPGGLFFWINLNRRIDTRQLLLKAIEAGVAFMPGEAFLPMETEGCGQIRLNFSFADAEQVEMGLRKLAGLIRRFE